MSPIAQNLRKVVARIRVAEKQYGRLANSVQLLAVSKTQSASAILEAYDTGQRAFGENYVQESLAKIEALNAYPLEWHFIGHIQSNKTKVIAQNFSWAHTVDSVKIAERLSTQRGADQAPLSVCLQVNISKEVSKSGVAVAALADLAEYVASLPRLKLRGLMTIPTPTEDVPLQRKSFALVRQCFETLQKQYPWIDTLSMGMSHDLEAAIAEGATVVRVGTAIFGSRESGVRNQVSVRSLD